MKKNLQKLNHCERILEIEVSPEEIYPIEEEVYQDIQRIAVLPGFRRGKAPLELVKKNYAKEAESEILKRSISKFLQEAIVSEDLVPIENPQVYEVNWEKGKPLSFKARFEVRPDFRLKPYKEMKIKKRKIEVKEEEIDKVLDGLKEKYAELVTVEGRSVKEGDFILCDYKSFVEKKVVEDRENVWLSLEEKMNVEGFAEKLYGANIGETKKFNLKIPPDVSDKEMAGKEVEIEVKIKEIKEKHFPELNDEFAKMVGNFNTLAELREGIRKDLFSLKEVQLRKDMEAQILDNLLNLNKFSVPVSLIERFKENYIKRLKEGLRKKGLGEEEIEKVKGEIEKKAEEYAERDVRIFFILEKIAEKENIKVSDEEVENHIRKLAEEWKEDFEKVKKSFIEKNLWEELRLELREERVLDFLLKNVQVIEEE